MVETQEEEEAVPRNANQVWTDDDLATLAKFIKKFPGGTADRWVKYKHNFFFRKTSCYLYINISTK